LSTGVVGVGNGMDIIDDDAGADTLSEYEIKRLEQIKKNNEHLASLGIQSDIEALNGDSKRRSKRSKRTAEKAAEGDKNPPKQKKQVKTRTLTPALTLPESEPDS
jgi:hypothetical protein